MKQEQTKKRAILLLDVDKFIFFEEGMSQPLQLAFEPSVVSHREVVSEKQFYDQISLFIQQNKLEGAHLYILLVSQLFFAHDFQVDPSKKTDVEEQKKSYLDAVPFERVSSFTQKVQNTERIYAANQDYYETAQNAFANAGFVVEGVVPIFLLGDQFSKANTISQELIQSVFSQESEIKKHSLVSNEPLLTEESTSEEEQGTTNDEKDNKTFTPRVIGLVAVFALLLIVLGLVVYFQVLRSPQAEQNTNSQASQMQPTLQPTPTTEQIVESFVLEIRTVDAEDGRVAEAVERLDDLGVSRVNISETPTLEISDVVTAFFLPGVSDDVRSIITDSLTEVFGEITVEEDNTIDTDVVVVIPNNDEITESEVTEQIEE